MPDQPGQASDPTIYYDERGLPRRIDSGDLGLIPIGPSARRRGLADLMAKILKTGK